MATETLSTVFSTASPVHHTSHHTETLSTVLSTASPIHHTSHHSMSRHQHSFSWSVNGTKTHHTSSGGTVTPCHSHTHSHGHSTSTRGTPTPTVTSAFPHVTLSSKGTNIPEGTGSDNGDQPTSTIRGGLMPVPLIHPTTTMSRHPHSRHSTTSLSSTAAPATTESHIVVSIPDYTGTLSWTTITRKPSIMTVPMSPRPVTDLPPEGLPPNSELEGPEDAVAAVMGRSFSSSSSTTWATSSPFTLHCDAGICKTYCYCGQDGRVICDYDPASCANTCDCQAS